MVYGADPIHTGPSPSIAVIAPDSNTATLLDETIAVR